MKVKFKDIIDMINRELYHLKIDLNESHHKDYTRLSKRIDRLSDEVQALKMQLSCDNIEQSYKSNSGSVGDRQTATACAHYCDGIFVSSLIDKLANGGEQDMRIKKVIFNNPATIVLWEDGTKTVVKCGELADYDPEKGLAMAIAKKALGNEGRYYETFKKWLPKEDTKGGIIDVDALNGIVTRLLRKD